MPCFRRDVVVVFTPLACYAVYIVSWSSKFRGNILVHLLRSSICYVITPGLGEISQHIVGPWL